MNKLISIIKEVKIKWFLGYLLLSVLNGLAATRIIMVIKEHNLAKSFDLNISLYEKVLEEQKHIMLKE